MTVVLQRLTDEVTGEVPNPTMATVNQAIGDLVTSAENAGYESSSSMTSTHSEREMKARLQASYERSKPPGHRQPAANRNDLQSQSIG